MSEPNLNERIDSAATPKTAGAIEEREAIAAWLERQASEEEEKYYEVERAGALRGAAREIRDGKHHEEE